MEELLQEVGDRFVFAGDSICSVDRLKNVENLKIGPGLMYNKSHVYSTQVGYLRIKLPNKLWLDYDCKYYTPSVGDNVIGVVVKTGPDFFNVDIGSSRLGLLDNLSFENATKRNRPKLNPGDLVYCQVIEIGEGYIEPILTCCTKSGKSMGLGYLNGSANSSITNIGVSLSKKLLTNQKNIISELKSLDSKYSFEIVIGVNGRLWIQSLYPFVSNRICNFFATCSSLPIDKIITEMKMTLKY